MLDCESALYIISWHSCKCNIVSHFGVFQFPSVWDAVWKTEGVWQDPCLLLERCLPQTPSLWLHPVCHEWNAFLPGGETESERGSSQTCQGIQCFFVFFFNRLFHQLLDLYACNSWQFLQELVAIDSKKTAHLVLTSLSGSLPSTVEQLQDDSESLYDFLRGVFKYRCNHCLSFIPGCE